MSGIPLSFTSVRPQTEFNLVLDSGIVVIDMNITILRSSGDFLQAVAASATWVKPNGVTTHPRFLGATRGGSTINMNKTERQVVVDGGRIDYVGLQRIDSIMPTLETSLLETADLFTAQIQMGSSTATVYAPYTQLRPNLIVVDTDYLGNVAIIATISGNSIPKIWVLENPRVTKSDAQSLKDKDELAQRVTFTANQYTNAINQVPYMEFVPTVSGS